MKYLKIIMVSFFVVSFLRLSAQDVIKLRAFQVTAISNSESIENAVWKPVNILTVINFDRKKINIYTKETQNIDLINVKEEKQTKEYYMVIYSGVDTEGLDCIITLMIYENKKNEHAATMFVSYSKNTVIYRLKKA